MIRTRPPLPLSGLAAARLGTPKSSAVTIATNTPNFAPGDALDRTNTRLEPRYLLRSSGGTP